MTVCNRVFAGILGLVLGAVCFLADPVAAHSVSQTKNSLKDKFRQLDEIWPTPNAYRTGGGAPGHAYWQQRADYVISVTIDDERQRLTGSQTITYLNQSPDRLAHLWLQLDQNRLRADSIQNTAMMGSAEMALSRNARESLLERENFPGGVEILSVEDGAGRDLVYKVVDTLMRLDLAEPLAPGESLTFSIDWAYNIHAHAKLGGRSGYEYFPEDENYIYLLAQWFPRLAVYSDMEGWHNKQFLGNGEFTLEFGDYDVSITVPADHVVAATGVLQNPEDVLTRRQRARLRQARRADEPVMIITEDEARTNEESKSRRTRTWRFKAENVRDFAFATSRKFLWDAQGVRVDGSGETIMAMSFYPREANPLWSRYATEANRIALETYSELLFPYPYPVSIAVNGPVGGMEYPMINFNGPRPRVNATTGERVYTEGIKRALASVIIHEVGHNWFPMIVNSDERQWTWMDEGLTSFVQMKALQRFDPAIGLGPFGPRGIARYMASRGQVPIMTQSDSIISFGFNSYAKPAAALEVLRTAVMGPDLFDHALRSYAQRWRFKRPLPADFFRTMEEVSGIDLDWFWHGWFYTTDHVDISIETMALLPALMRDGDSSATGDTDGPYFHRVEFSNIGGLVMPIILQAEFAEGEPQLFRFPAELWNQNDQRTNKLLITDRPITRLTLDPFEETADAVLSNNIFPRARGAQPMTSSMEPEDTLTSTLSAKRRASSDDVDWEMLFPHYLGPLSVEEHEAEKEEPASQRKTGPHYH